MDSIYKWMVKNTISKYTKFRGGEAKQDGDVTLLTVNYRSPEAISRLVRSFQKFVGSDAQAVVVENYKIDPGIRAMPHVKYVNRGINLSHGLGLDYGMKHVTTQWALICDPDSAIISAQFVPRMLELAAGTGIAGIDSAHLIYHPICLLFATEIWKWGDFSFMENWPWYDVAGELTNLVGGRKQENLLPRSRVAGPRFRLPMYLIEVYADLFTNTYLGSRIKDPVSDENLGLPRDVVLQFHEKYYQWIEAVISGSQTIADFPFPAQPEIDANYYDIAPLLGERMGRTPVIVEAERLGWQPWHLRG